MSNEGSNPPLSSRLFLLESLAELEAATARFHYSFHATASIVQPEPCAIESMSESQLETIEAFTSRFSRLVDLLTNKVLRALDRYELTESLTLLDVANRAEKRNLIPSTDWLRELKDTRNRIAHDYAGAEMREILE